MKFNITIENDTLKTEEQIGFLLHYLNNKSSWLNIPLLVYRDKDNELNITVPCKDINKLKEQLGFLFDEIINVLRKDQNKYAVRTYIGKGTGYLSLFRIKNDEKHNVSFNLFEQFNLLQVLMDLEIRMIKDDYIITLYVESSTNDMCVSITDIDGTETIVYKKNSEDHLNGDYIHENYEKYMIYDRDTLKSLVNGVRSNMLQLLDLNSKNKEK